MTTVGGVALAQQAADLLGKRAQQSLSLLTLLVEQAGDVRRAKLMRITVKGRELGQVNLARQEIGRAHV